MNELSEYQNAWCNDKNFLASFLPGNVTQNCFGYDWIFVNKSVSNVTFRRGVQLTVKQAALLGSSLPLRGANETMFYWDSVVIGYLQFCIVLAPLFRHSIHRSDALWMALQKDPS